MTTTRFILTILITSIFVSQAYCVDKASPKSEYPIIDTSEKNNIKHLPGDNPTQKIIKRTNLEREGDYFAKQGLYEEALTKYKAAQDPSLLNYEYEKPELPIIQLYIRLRKFEQALQIVDDNLKKRPKNDEVIRERLELLALIKARDTKDNKPIYEYINYVKTQYAKYFPPNGYLPGVSGWLISDLIYLYDYMYDYDSGITFMDKLIKYHTQHPNKNHRSAHVKDVREYTRVKHAWELDKQTGKHGHLQDVIKTSDFISW